MPSGLGGDRAARWSFSKVFGGTCVKEYKAWEVTVLNWSLVSLVSTRAFSMFESSVLDPEIGELKLLEVSWA